MDWLKEKDPLFVFQYEISKFWNPTGCEGHTLPPTYVTAGYPSRFYYIFKREEPEEWLCCICRENELICGYCKDC